MYTESARVCFRFYFHCSVILLSLLGPPTHTHILALSNRAAPELSSDMLAPTVPKPSHAPRCGDH